MSGFASSLVAPNAPLTSIRIGSQQTGSQYGGTSKRRFGCGVLTTPCQPGCGVKLPSRVPSLRWYGRRSRVARHATARRHATRQAHWQFQQRRTAQRSGTSIMSSNSCRRFSVSRATLLLAPLLMTLLERSRHEQLLKRCSRLYEASPMHMSPTVSVGLCTIDAVGGCIDADGMIAGERCRRCALELQFVWLMLRPMSQPQRNRAITARSKIEPVGPVRLGAA
mmetsp:Transcript_37534/g.62147  ORF Transcript_37534/g.62147 Transcript_37534/m.62147 type:complete len:223 (+) Transcript_37534:1051-1719(+)